MPRVSSASSIASVAAMSLESVRSTSMARIGRSCASSSDAGGLQQYGIDGRQRVAAAGDRADRFEQLLRAHALVDEAVGSRDDRRHSHRSVGERRVEDHLVLCGLLDITTQGQPVEVRQLVVEQDDVGVGPVQHPARAQRPTRRSRPARVPVPWRVRPSGRGVRRGWSSTMAMRIIASGSPGSVDEERARPPPGERGRRAGGGSR